MSTAPTTAGADRRASPAQRGIWLASRGGEAASGYVIVEMLRLRDPHRAALERSLAALAQRHELLRASYRVVDGELRQRVERRIESPLELVDARRAEAHRDVLREYAQAELDRGYDLAAAPLWRCSLLLAEREATLVFAVHHLIADGVSMRILVSELAQLYEAERTGGRAALPATPPPYHDAVRADPAAVERALAWWRARLHGCDRPPPLPADRPRSPGPHRSATAHARLTAAVTARLAALAAAHDATQFIALVALVGVLLQRYSGSHEVALGTVLSTRTRPSTRGVVGPILETLLLRPVFDPCRGFGAAVDAARRAIVDSLRHSAVPFDLLAHEVGDGRDGARHPLFDVMVALDDAGPAPAGAFEPIDPHELLETRVARFELTLSFTPGSEGIDVMADFDADLFDADRIERMLGHLAVLAAAATADADGPICRLDLMTAAERELVAVRFPAPARDEPAGGGHLVELFDRVAAERPDAPAVGGVAPLSYAELKRRSERMAAALAACGHGPGAVLATRADPSADTIAAWLGILRLGAAYLPLDPAWPAARVSELLVRAGATEVVGHGLVVGAPATHPTPGARSGRDPAYLIFTSGSSGTPKGVVVAHESVANLARAFADELALAPGARIPLVASVGFDALVMELWPAMLAGATVLPLDRDARGDPGMLAELMISSAVTHCFVPTALLPLLLDRAGDRLPASLTLWTGGEPLVLDHLPRVPLVNAYGPTECTVAATWTRVTPDMVPGAVPIGRPIQGARVDVLDAHGEPMPIGIDGEICISGRCLAQRVLGAGPDEAHFAAGPLVPGGRMYRTGDRGRWRRDGLLEFRGRDGDQVQVRGQRVEPAEVECWLLAQPELAQAAVVQHGDGPRARLVAWVVARTRAVDATELRRRMAGELPRHLIPAQVEVVDALPLTVGGKVDRTELAQRAPSRPRPAVRGADRGNEVVTGVWTDVLGVTVGADDDLFDLGATSLDMIVVAARLSDAVGLEVPVRTVMLHATPASCAAALAELDGGRSVTPPIRGDRARSSWPLTTTQAQLLALQRRLAGSSPFHLSRRVWLTDGAAPDAWRAACERLAARHPILRSRLDPDRGEMVLAHDEPPLRVFSAATGADGLAVEHALAAAAHAPLLPEHEPPWRVDLVSGSDDQLLQVTLHHAAGDARSLGVVVDELVRLVRGDPLAPLPYHFGDVAAWRAARLVDGALDADWAYWRDVLRQPLAPLGWPGRPAADDPFSSRALSRELPIAAEERLRPAPFAAVAAALATVLARELGAGDVRIGTNVSTRTAAAMDAIVGPFVNTAVVRLAAGGQPARDELAEAARRALAEALSHRELPLETVVAQLRREGREDLAHAAPVMLLVDDERAARARWPAGLRAGDLEDEHLGLSFTASDLVVGAQLQPGRLALSLVHREAACDSMHARALLDALAGALGAPV